MTEGIIKFPARTTDPDTDPSYQQVYYKDGYMYVRTSGGDVVQLSPPDGLVTTEHTHAKLVASDGSPDPALSADASGALTAAVSLALASGAAVNEFSIDGTMSGNSDAAVPTEKAVKAYVDANAGGGKVLQVVQGTYATQVNNTSTSYADTGLSASITPGSASNKILVLCSMSVGTENSARGMYVKLVRGATDVAVLGRVVHRSRTTNNSTYGYGSHGMISPMYLDSPATTSAVTYKIQFALEATTGTAQAQVGDVTSTMILLEIAG